MSEEVEETSLIRDKEGNVDGVSIIDKLVSAPPKESGAVTLERKEELLLEARRARVAWVDASSYPYNTAAIRERGDEDDGYKLLGSTRVAQSMKRSLIPILKELYSSNDAFTRNGNCAGATIDPTSRIRKQFDSLIAAGDLGKVLLSHKYPSTYNNNSTGTSTDTNNDSHTDDYKSKEEEDVQYRLFLQKLRSPECADLVQTMKHFVQTFEDTVRQALEESNGNEDIKLIRTNISSAIQTYLSKLEENEIIAFFQNNNNFSPTATEIETAENDDHNDHSDTMKMMEIFSYSKCHEAIMSVFLADEELQTQEQQFQDKLTSLQFITPKHLELDYLQQYANDTTTTTTTTTTTEDHDWRKVLEIPCQTLKKMNDLVSPGQMLECALEVYRGINVCLQNAKGEHEVAGADDVLPAWILTVLCSSSERYSNNNICTQLQFIECFATPNQLRGEAGYAYTNFYGAVQFLKDLKEDNSSCFSKMTPEEFKQGLQHCRNVAQQRIHTVSTTCTTKEEEEEKEKQQSSLSPSLQISPKDVREARLTGETLDLQWACRWYDQKTKDEAAAAVPPVIETAPPLPEGFRRKYRFLSCTPEDVRLSDVPMLLEEYQMLVCATESLLAERMTRIQKEQQMQNKR